MIRCDGVVRDVAPLDGRISPLGLFQNIVDNGVVTGSPREPQAQTPSHDLEGEKLGSNPIALILAKPHLKPPVPFLHHSPCPACNSLNSQHTSTAQHCVA